jgi:hypothetical protein
VPYDTAFEMDPAEQWAACVVFGELGMNVRTALRFDWNKRSWEADCGG